ncbi:MAG: Ig domain-containing protein, partial [Elstera sp.]
TASGSLGVIWEGQAASLALGAAGADQYEIVGGILPWGLRLDRSTGALTGTPADMGGAVLDPLETYTWSAPVSSDLGIFAVGATLNIAQTTAPTAGSFYLLSGGLPWGLTLSRGTGLVSGTVSAEAVAGTYALTIARIDTNGRFGTRAYTITIT